MSLIVYKQRHGSVNSKTTAGLSSAHVRYIGTRPGAALLSEEHALFGNIRSLGNVSDFSLDDLCAHVYQKGKEGKLMFRGVLSMRSEDAKRIHVEDSEDWRAFLRRSLPVLASKNGIDLTSLSWIGAVHEKGSEKHVHVLFYDESDRIHSDFVPPARISNIRTELIQLHFREELRVHLKESDRQKETLLSRGKEQLLTFLAKGGEDRLCRALSDLLKTLPRKGRLVERYFPPETKAMLDQTVRLLLHSTKEIEEASARYLEAKMPIAAMMGGDMRLHRDRYLLEIEDIARKAVLRAVRSYQKEHAGEREETEEEPSPHRSTMLHRMHLLSLVHETVLAALEAQSRGSASYTARRDLSKEARKERIRREDKTR